MDKIKKPIVTVNEKDFKDKLSSLKRSLIIKIFEGIWFVIVFGLIPFIEFKITGKSSNIHGARNVERLIFKASSQKFHGQ